MVLKQKDVSLFEEKQIMRKYDLRTDEQAIQRKEVPGKCGSKIRGERKVKFSFYEHKQPRTHDWCTEQYHHPENCSRIIVLLSRGYPRFSQERSVGRPF
jgi:hypothetical protein